MSDRPRGLAFLPASRGATRLVSRQLAAARKAADRFGLDPEAVHDFRVALRRLRVLLKTYPAALGFLRPRKAARRAGKLARATSSRRDAEVLLAWLGRLESGLDPQAREGIGVFRARLSGDEGAAEELEGVRQSFAGFEAGIAAAIEEARAKGRTSGEVGGPFGPLAAAAIREAAGELAAALDAITGPGDEEQGHRARISGKRLRYLLEPFQSAGPQARRAVAGLRKLQDLLGDVHDLTIFLAELSACASEDLGRWACARVAEAAGGRDAGLAGADPLPGLLLLAERTGAQRRERFEELRTAWPTGRAKDGLAGVEAVAEGLGALTPR